MRFPSLPPINRGLVLSSPPAIEPVTLTEAKQWLRVDISDDDSLISSLVTAARQWCETFLARSFITQTWQQTTEQFPLWNVNYQSYQQVMYLCRPPLQSVTSIVYVDTTGTTQTLSSSAYVVDTTTEPGRITPVYSSFFPIARWQPKSVTVTFVAGYGDTADKVPESIKTAIKLLIGHWYDNRSSVEVGTIATKVPLAVESLLYLNSYGKYD